MADNRATLAYSPSAVVALRRSSALLAATLAFAALAAFGLYAMLAPLAGAAAGLVLCLAGYAALMLVARAQLWGRVVALGIDSDSIAAYDRQGRTLVHGPIVGCSQWANRLLVIAIRPEGRTRVASLVVAADSLDAETFRSLAVRARNGAHHHL